MAERIIFEHNGKVLDIWDTTEYVSTSQIESIAWYLAKREKVRYRDITIRVETAGEDDA